jgi:hypothetical protein
MATEETDARGEAGAGKRCSRCGAGFRCGRESGDPSCWCAALPNVLPVPGSSLGGGCLCPDCLGRAVEAAGAPQGNCKVGVTCGSGEGEAPAEPGNEVAGP